MIPFLLIGIFTFTPGEKFEYVAKYAFLTLGEMTLEIKDTLSYDNTPCYHFSSILSSSPMFRFLFSINDTIDVYSTIEDLVPLYYEEKLHESDYENHTLLTFDHESLLVKYSPDHAVELEEGARDLLSFWYYLRTIPLDVGDTIHVVIHKSEENYPIPCYVRKEEVIKTPYGEFNTVLVEPDTEGKGVFGSSGGMKIWYSLDEMRYPVQIKAIMKSGNILFKLEEVTY